MFAVRTAGTVFQKEVSYGADRKSGGISSAVQHLLQGRILHLPGYSASTRCSCRLHAGHLRRAVGRFAERRVHPEPRCLADDGRPTFQYGRAAPPAEPGPSRRGGRAAFPRRRHVPASGGGSLYRASSQKSATGRTGDFRPPRFGRSASLRHRHRHGSPARDGSPPPANCSSRNSKTWTGWKNGKWALHESPDLYQPSSMSY